MSFYSTPTILKERLENGRKIPVIIYELNPLREPNSRIHYYRKDFNKKTDKTFSFLNLKKNKNKKKAKSVGKAKRILYNSFYANLLRINFERPREIKNKDGVIISRHFRSLFINSREYPKANINIFSIKNKFTKERKINFKNEADKNKTYNGNFFSTQIKYNSNLIKNKRNFNNYQNENKIFNHENNNNFSRTIYNLKTNNFLLSKNENQINYNESSKVNNKIYSKEGNIRNHPLLFKSY